MMQSESKEEEEEEEEEEAEMDKQGVAVRSYPFLPMGSRTATKQTTRHVTETRARD